MGYYADPKSAAFRISELCQIISSCRIHGGNPKPYYTELELLLENYQLSKQQPAKPKEEDGLHLLASLR
ncbi:hypothetical protein [Dendrosporobacter sp. 1207_IL3150]|uniref:hypothetical protein n=1 Tax=Dendrosporobacter sp. 1207_IL3150 TaxID=3084054 RepID=UPI002FD8DDC6